MPIVQPTALPPLHNILDWKKKFFFIFDFSKIVFDAGSKKGDGFSSNIVAVDFEATVDGQRAEKSYIVKCDPGPKL